MEKLTILEVIEAKHKSSGGHCGVYLQSFDGDTSEIKKELNRLLKMGIIKAKEGIHGRLAILNKKYEKPKTP